MKKRKTSKNKKILINNNIIKKGDNTSEKLDLHSINRQKIKNYNILNKKKLLIKF